MMSLRAVQVLAVGAVPRAGSSRARVRLQMPLKILQLGEHAEADWLPARADRRGLYGVHQEGAVPDGYVAGRSPGLASDKALAEALAAAEGCLPQPLR